MDPLSREIGGECCVSVERLDRRCFPSLKQESRRVNDGVGHGSRGLGS